MRSFQDRAGRTWAIEITVSTLKRIRSLAKVDVGQLIEDAELVKKLDDMPTMGGVLYAILQPQAQTAQVSEESFLDALDGPAMARAAAALWPELDDFFRPCLPLVGGLIALAMEVRSSVLAKEKDAPESASGSESTSSQAPSESIPTPAPSAS